MGSSKERIAFTARDRRILEYIYRFRLLSRDQVMALAPFQSLTRANTRLSALTREGILRRKMLPVFPGHGSAQSLYFLGKASRPFLRIDRLSITQVIRQVSRWDLRQVEHVRTANHALLSLLVGLRAVNASAISFRTEPELRKRLHDRTLVPDGWVEWTFAAKRFNCFLEVDLHHEGLQVWREKVLAYVAYAESGLHQEYFGYHSFRVLVLAGPGRRLGNLRQVASAAGSVFLLAEISQVTAESALGPIWQAAAGSGQVALMEA
jgi:hypothetical protein